MSLHDARSEAENVKASYVTLRMQLKLVLGYLRDEVPETALARQFLLEAKKTALELDQAVVGLIGVFEKVDSGQGKNAVEKLDRLHKFVLSCSGNKEGGIVDAMNKAEETILKNDVEEAVKLLDSLQLGLELNEANTDLGDVDWESMKCKEAPEPDLPPARKGKGKKVSIVYLSNPENEYLAENLVGRFFKELDIEPTYVTDKGGGEIPGDADAVFALFTKDAARSEEYAKRLENSPRRRTVVYAESGADMPQEIGNRFETRYFSRDRTGELLIEMVGTLKSRQVW
ncbi:MAG: hypothetical protein JTT11_09670 [Candidatus Brockarchaeota archaeon]|nr:hypothetical protein [Candidatus Brockarchaeota archaeon]